MLVIRYFRIGKINQPYYKVVVTDKRRPTKGGRFVEEVGFIDPVKKVRKLKADRIKYWLSVGAQPSDTVHNLLISEKITEGKKIPVHHKKKVKEGTATSAAAPAPAVKGSEAPKAEAKKEEPKKEEAKPEVKAEAPKVEEKPAA
jgi:small subunit ribosomal protein S16